MNTLVIEGADIFDVGFTLHLPDFPEIMWNITRMEHDAFKGAFGEWIEVPFDQMAPHPLDDPWQHLEQVKVQQIIRDADKRVERNGNFFRLIDLPGIAVAIQNPVTGQMHGIPVDGNHRGKAREIMGLTGLRQFMVPARLEGRYRVTIRES